MRFTRLDDWLAWQETLHPQAIELGLERVSRVLARTGWRRPAHPVITVGGTNGKGSCVALCDSILTAAGLRTGTFTSPHLEHYTERIRIAGRDIDDASLVTAFDRIDAARGEDSLTFFEFNTLAALLVFETAGLDACILEVGLGGRLDAVNVVDADVALVTSIALDHTEWLGPDVESIGREKAGIFRRGRPAVFASPKMPASIAEVANEVGASLQRLGREFDFRVDPSGRWTWQGDGESFDGLPRPALPGSAQYANAAGVMAALRALHGCLPVSRPAIEEGLKRATLAGRFECHGGPVGWIFDVAHNPAAAAVLAGNLVACRTRGRTIAVCGVLADKDVEGFVVALRGVVDEWILVVLPGPRAATARELERRFAAAGVTPRATAADVDAACEMARVLAQPEDRVVVCGSFLTVGPARAWFRRIYSAAWKHI